MIVSKRKKQVNNSKEIAKIFRALLESMEELDQGKENFWLAILNTRNIIQSIHLISQGCLSSSIVHPREVFRPAVIEGAASVIVGHNHPSGNPDPSREDQKLTDRLKEVGTLLGIRLTDHVIIAEGGFVSMMDPTVPKACTDAWDN